MNSFLIIIMCLFFIPLFILYVYLVSTFIIDYLVDVDLHDDYVKPYLKKLLKLE